jgi:leucyl-tRNA synthetase
MECVNELYLLKAKDNFKSSEWQWALETLIKLLAPFAPHITEELWEQLGQEDSVHLASWPIHDDKYLVEDQVTVVIQINGKVRGKIQVATDASEEDVISMAKQDEKVAGYINNQEIKKTIYVPNKLISFVL